MENQKGEGAKMTKDTVHPNLHTHKLAEKVESIAPSTISPFLNIYS